MKAIESDHLIDLLQADVRKLILTATHLQSMDPEALHERPSVKKWNVVQILEHLNSYGRYYLLAIEKSMRQHRPAVARFSPGWLGDYFTRLMKPAEDGQVHHKMQSPKDHRPPKDLDFLPVLNEFLEQQRYLLDLLALAREKNIGRIRVPISLSKFIRLKLGDTFRFVIAHEQRHFVQIHTTLAAVKEAKDKLPVILPAM
jgi:hypothetical protein